MDSNSRRSQGPETRSDPLSVPASALRRHLKPLLPEMLVQRERALDLVPAYRRTPSSEEIIRQVVVVPLPDISLP